MQQDMTTEQLLALVKEQNDESRDLLNLISSHVCACNSWVKQTLTALERIREIKAAMAPEPALFEVLVQVYAPLQTYFEERGLTTNSRTVYWYEYMNREWGNLHVHLVANGFRVENTEDFVEALRR